MLRQQLALGFQGLDNSLLVQCSSTYWLLVVSVEGAGHIDCCLLAV